MVKILISCMMALVIANNAVGVILCEVHPCGNYANTLKSRASKYGSYDYNGGLMIDYWAWRGTGVGNGTSWGESGCFASAGSPSGSGAWCWCRITDVCGIICTGPWIYDMKYTNATECMNWCAYGCAYSAWNGQNGSCTRNALYAF